MKKIKYHESFQGAKTFFATYREHSAGVRLAIITSLLKKKFLKKMDLECYHANVNTISLNDVFHPL